MRASPDRRGFTLVEAMIALVVSAVVMAAFMGVLTLSHRHMDNVTVIGDLETDANDAVDHIADELRQAGVLSPGWTLQQNMVWFNPCSGQSAGTATWDSTRLLALSPMSASEDIWDGVDNNGDGLIDEGRLVLSSFDATGAHQQVLANYVASGGLVFSQSGNDITVTLTLKRLNDDGVPMSVTASTLVSLRN